MSKIRGFEKVSAYAGVDLTMPVRKTEYSCGYDIAAAEDMIIEPYAPLINQLYKMGQDQKIGPIEIQLKKLQEEGKEEEATKLFVENIRFDLDELKALTKSTKIKPTLVPTGMKAYMQKDEVLKLYVRSSSPLNYWIIMANSTGLIDADYYNNPDNEGHIYFQLINLSPFPLKIKKGEILGQGVFEKYLVTDDDNKQAKDTREGGFGSTTK